MISLPLPKPLNRFEEYSDLVNEYKIVNYLEDLLSSDLEDIELIPLEIHIGELVKLASKYNLDLEYFDKELREVSAIPLMMDLEGSIFSKLRDAIKGSIDNLRNEMSDFNKRLSISLKSKPIEDVLNKLKSHTSKEVELKGKGNLGYLNRSFNAYAKVNDIKSLSSLLSSLSEDDFSAQVDNVKKVVDYLSLVKVEGKDTKELLVEFKKEFKSFNIDKKITKELSGNLFKIPKLFSNIGSEIKNKEIEIFCGGTLSNRIQFLIVGPVKKNFIQKVIKIKYFSDRVNISPKDNSFYITDTLIKVSELKPIISNMEKELKYINNEIAKLYGSKMPIIKGMNYPDSSYFDVYNALYFILFSRYSSLMDILKVTDLILKEN